MLIIGVLSTFVLPVMEKHLSAHPKIHERLLQTYLGCLLFGDVSRIYQKQTHPR